MLFPESPWRMVQRPFLPPFQEGFLLGTDTMGRNVAAGLMHGAWVSLLIGLVSTRAALLIGALGAIAGYYGGLVDDALMRFTEFFQTIPNFSAIVLVAIMQPASPRSSWRLRLSAGCRWRAWCARVHVAAQPRVCRSRPLAGQSNSTIILRQILPNTLSPSCWPR